MSEGTPQSICKVQIGDSKTLAKTKTVKSDTKGDSGPRRMDIPDCAVCLQTCVHPVELPCGHVFCFLCMKGASTQYRRCALCRQEIPIDFFTSPKLLLLQDEESEEKEEESKGRYTWFYEGRNGWWQYDERTDDELEESYCANKRTFELLIAGYVYVIDLDSMLQYRRSDPSRRRRIKRDLVGAAKKGIAGLKIKVKREEESGERQVDGAEEDKENVGAVGGAAASPPSDNGIVQSKGQAEHDRSDPSPEEGVKDDEGCKVTRTPSPNANHSNSTNNETVYEVVQSVQPNRTSDQSPPTFRYTNSTPANDPSPPYAVPVRQRRRPANQSTVSASNSRGSSPTRHSDATPLRVPSNHQRTHSAPEPRPSARPRGPAPPAPSRAQTTQLSARSSSTRTGDDDADVETVAETMRSELVINVGPNSGARRRQVHHQVHEV